MLSLFARFAIISNFEKKKKQIDIDLIISIEQYIYIYIYIDDKKVSFHDNQFFSLYDFFHLDRIISRFYLRYPDYRLRKYGLSKQ